MPIYRLYDNFDRTGYSAPAFMGPEPAPGFKRMTYSPPTLVTPVIDAPHITEDNQNETFVYEKLNNWTDYGESTSCSTRDGRWYPANSPSFLGLSLSIIEAPSYLPIKYFLQIGYDPEKIAESLSSSSATYRSGHSKHEYNMGFNYSNDLAGANLIVGGNNACYTITKGSFDFGLPSDDFSGGAITDGFMSIFMGHGYVYSGFYSQLVSTLQIEVYFWQQSSAPQHPVVSALNLLLAPTVYGMFNSDIHSMYRGSYQRAYVHAISDSLVGKETKMYGDGVANVSPFLGSYPVYQDYTYPMAMTFSTPSIYSVNINPLLSHVDTMGRRYAFDSFCFTAPMLAGYSTAWPDHTKGFYVDDYSCEIEYEEVGSSGWQIGSVLGGTAGSIGAAQVWGLFAPWGGVLPK